MQCEYPSFNGYSRVSCQQSLNNFDSGNVTSTSSLFTSFSTQSSENANKKIICEIKCDVCNLLCPSQVVYYCHLKGKRHTRALNIASHIKTTSHSKTNKETADVCKDCEVICSTMEQLRIHMSGNKHKKVIKIKQYNELMLNKDPSVYCDICDLYLLPTLMTLHREGVKHKRKFNVTSSNDQSTDKTALSVITTVEFCGLCNMMFNLPEEAVAHYQSPSHLIVLDIHRRMTSFHCDPCHLYLPSEDSLTKHLNGFRHYVVVNRGNANPEGAMRDKLLKMRDKMRTLKTRKKTTKEDVVPGAACAGDLVP